MKYQIGNTNGHNCTYCDVFHPYNRVIEMNHGQVVAHLANGAILRQYDGDGPVNTEGCVTHAEASASLAALTGVNQLGGAP